MYSDTTHQLNGKPATATLMEHIKTCTVEYQRVGQERRKDPMACDAAEQFQRLTASNKIKVSHEILARGQFRLMTGRDLPLPLAQAAAGLTTGPEAAT